jgi:hypothetical protein
MRDEPPDSPHKPRLRTAGSGSQDASSTAARCRRHHPAAAPSLPPPGREAECARAARLRADSARTLKRLSGRRGRRPPVRSIRPRRTGRREVPHRNRPGRRRRGGPGRRWGTRARLGPVTTSGQLPGCHQRDTTRGAKPRDFPASVPARRTNAHPQSLRRARPPHPRSSPPAGHDRSWAVYLRMQNDAVPTRGRWLAWPGPAMPPSAGAALRGLALLPAAWWPVETGR